MSRTWQLQEAKNKLSELITCAQQEGPQRITRRGENAAVVISAEDYDRMTQPEESLVDFFRKSPLRGLVIERSKDLPRKVKL